MCDKVEGVLPMAKSIRDIFPSTPAVPKPFETLRYRLQIAVAEKVGFLLTRFTWRVLIRFIKALWLPVARPGSPSSGSALPPAAGASSPSPRS